MKNECTDLSKKHQNGRHFEILTAILEFCRYFGVSVLLENDDSSHNLIVKCRILLNSIKQSMFLCPPNLNHIFTLVHVNELDLTKFSPIYHYL